MGPSLDNAFPDSRTPNPLHITLLTPAEAKAHPPPPATVPLEHIYVLDVARRGQVSFAVVVWVHGNAARRAVGLGPKEFHVTLSATDDHGIPKGSAQLPLDIDGVALLGLEALDHVFLAAPAWQISIAERMVLDYPCNFKGYVRLAAVSPPKVACMAYARAAVLNPDLRGRVIKELRRRSTEASYGPTMTEAEVDSIPSALLPHLTYPWPDLSTGFWSYECDSSSSQLFQDHRVPAGFSFVYPRVCASSAPRSLDDIRALEGVGVTHVLTLTAESWLPGEWFDNSRANNSYIENVHVPILSTHSPTLAEMDAILARIQAGGTWLVHCADGARTGTVLVCLAAMLGEESEEGVSDGVPKLTAQSAIRLVRRARPCSLSERQEHFVAEWVAHRWKRQAIQEPVTELDVSGDVLPRVLVLVGLPGSGKSWFCRALTERAAGGVVTVGEDNGDSRSGRLREFAGFTQNRLTDGFVVLDRCNLTKSERVPWLATCEKAVAVWFDYDPELCKQRIGERIDDPTTRARRRHQAVTAANSTVEPPTLSEFAGVLRISSVTAAREALALLAPVSPVEMLSTPYLGNLDTLEAGPRGTLSVEEKLDGVSLAISLDAHGHIRMRRSSEQAPAPADDVQSHLGTWATQYERGLRRILGRDEHFPERFTLFGVWVPPEVGRRRSETTDTKGVFFASDLYDRAAAGGHGFVSRDVLERLLCGEIPAVPLLGLAEKVSRDEVLDMLKTRSVLGGEGRRGLVIRWQEGDYTFTRGKVVREALVSDSRRSAASHVLKA